MAYILLIIGFVFLVKGADLFVSGSSSIAGYFRIPAFIVGLTIVAMGTSLPEAAISVTAALEGANGIAVGNALGSNMFNLLVVLGATAVVSGCAISKENLKFEYPVSIASMILLSMLAGGVVVRQTNTVSVLTRMDGIILLLVFAVFMILMVRKALTDIGEIDYIGGGEDASEKSDEISLPKAALISVIGLGGIFIGGDMVVESAVKIATGWGIDEVLIGLTIVALGTSLPELVISVVAALKGEPDIAIGNVIGSNIFNILLVLGISATIHPIAISTYSMYDMIIFIAASLVVLIPLMRKQMITRGWGILMLFMYIAYLVYAISRTM